MRILKTEVSSMHEDENAPSTAFQAASPAAPLQAPASPAASPDAQAQIDALSKQLSDLQQSVKTTDSAQAQ
jgi:hypothetical protein